MVASTHTPSRPCVVALLACALLGGACTGSADSAGGAAASHDAHGDTATLLTSFTEPTDVAGVEALIDAFENDHPDATISHEGVQSFEARTVTRTEDGDAPAMLMISEPHMLDDIRDTATPLEFLDVDDIEASYVSGVVRSGMVGDQLVGLPVRLRPRSLVWYPKAAFDEAGYEVPQTWDDLLTLTERIKADMSAQGIAPWCLGIEDGPATGEVLTDWIEDVVLRLHGPQVYDAWIGHGVAFDSPEIRAAWERVAAIWFAEGNVLGERQNIVATNRYVAPEPMLEQPPACLLHLQSSSTAALFPDAEFGTDYDVFALPPITGKEERAMLTETDLLVALEDTPVVRAFVAYASTSAAQEAWATAGSMVCAHTGCDLDAYPDDLTRRLGETIQQADVTRVDASDLMPARIGDGAFLAEGTAWVDENQGLDATLAAIDAAWPAGACGIGGTGPDCATTRYD